MAVVALLLGVVTMVSGSSPKGPALVYPNGSDNATAYASMLLPGQETLSFGEIIVCLDRPGEVTVDRVTPIGSSGGVRVVAFSLRPNPAAAGGGGLLLSDALTALVNVGFSPVRHRIRTPCKGAGSELGVQLHQSGPGHGTMLGLRVRWHSAGRRGVLVIPWGYVLCRVDQPEKVHTTPACSTGALLDRMPTASSS